jgi:hypothetical protein
MFKDFEKPKFNTYSQAKQELNYDGLPESLQNAFDIFTELSPKSQQAILEKITTLRQESEKRPVELLNEVKVLVRVYRGIEDRLSKKGKGSKKAEAKQEESREAAEFVRGIEELFEARIVDARSRATRRKNGEDGDNVGYSERLRQWNRSKESRIGGRETVRHPETVPESEI